MCTIHDWNTYRESKSRIRLVCKRCQMIAYWDENLGRIMAPEEKIRPPLRGYYYSEQKELA